MQRTLALITSLGRTTIDDSEFEVFAEAEADYDAPSQELAVQLQCYLRPEDVTRPIQRLHPEWLPRAQTDREHVRTDEASDLAKDIFKRWCTKVRGSVPYLHPDRQ